jgi:hypothetical protein
MLKLHWRIPDVIVTTHCHQFTGDKVLLCAWHGLHQAINGLTLFPGIMVVILGDAVTCIGGSPTTYLRCFITKFLVNPLNYGLTILIITRRLF